MTLESRKKKEKTGEKTVSQKPTKNEKKKSVERTVGGAEGHFKSKGESFRSPDR